MLRILRYLKGYVFFVAKGGFAERFVNLCRLRGIFIWNAKNDGVNVSAFTNRSELELLREAAEQSGMELIIEKENGLKTFIKQHKWRLGIFFGIAFIIVFLSIMSCFIWEIEIVCDDAVKLKTFTEELELNGIKKGALKSEIDTKAIASLLLAEHRDYHWVKINIFGSKLKAEMKVADDSAEILDHNAPTNIVARKNGRVTLVKGFYGQNVVEEGDYVAEGSLLISGIGRYSDGSEHKFHAKGEVFAQTQTVIEYSFARNDSFDCVIDSGRRYYLYFFGLKLPLGFGHQGTIQSFDSSFLGSKNGDLPIGIMREDSLKAEKRELSFSEDETLLFCLKSYAQGKRAEFKNAEIEDINLKTEFKEGKATLKASVKAIENIAQEQIIEIQEEN